MGPNREEDRFTHVVLAGKLEFVVFLEDSGVHAMMWETSDPTELSKTFHDIPIRHRTKASELIEALVKGRFRFEVLFGGNERLALGSPQGALAEGSVKFSDGKVTDAEFIIPRKSLEAEGRKRLMTELLGEKAATQMDLSERIPPGEANTKGRFGLVRNQWNTREDTYWIELSPCREDDAELESQLQALIEFLQKPTASAPSISEIRARIDALEKTVASMPSSRPGVEATKKRLERLKKLFDLQPPSPE
jgi:hypothetical protein